MQIKPAGYAVIILTAVAAGGYGLNLALSNGQVKMPVESAPVVAIQPQVPVQSPVHVQPQVQVPAQTQSAYDRIMSTGTIHVSVQSPSLPFYISKGGRASGFNVDFMQLLFSQGAFAGKQLVVAPSEVDTYPEVPAALNKDPATDIAIDGLTFEDQDPAGVVYTVPYVEDFGYAVIAPGNMMVRSLNEIGLMTIGVLQGDPDVKALVKRVYPQAKIKELSDASTNGERSWIKNALQDGFVDVVVYDYPFGVSEIAGTNLQFLATKIPGSNLKYRIGVRAGDTKLLDTLNVAIRRAKNDPSYPELIRRYFATENKVAVVEVKKTEEIYIVKRGDTLSTIAQVKLGSKMRYGEIEIRNNIANVNLIFEGQKLILPKV